MGGGRILCWAMKCGALAKCTALLTVFQISVIWVKAPIREHEEVKNKLIIVDQMVVE